MVEESGNAFEYENDEVMTGGTDTNFVDDEEVFPTTSNPNLNTCAMARTNFAIPGMVHRY